MRLLLLTGGALAILFCSGVALAQATPAKLPYAGGPVPDGYVPTSRPSRGPLITGSLLLGIPYALTLLPEETSDWALIPAVGPWIQLATRDCSAGECNRDSTTMVISGILQTTGAALLIHSFVKPDRYLKRQPGVALAPQISPHGMGLGAVAWF